MGPTYFTQMNENKDNEEDDFDFFERVDQVMSQRSRYNKGGR